jgi:hypothetical protein
MIEEGMIAKLEIEDGDCLVLTTPNVLSFEQRGRIHENASELLRRVNKEAQIIILEGGMTASVLKTSQFPEAA